MADKPLSDAELKLQKFKHRQILDSCYLALNLLRDIPNVRPDVKMAAEDLLKRNLRDG